MDYGHAKYIYRLNIAAANLGARYKNYLHKLTTLFTSYFPTFACKAKLSCIKLKATP